MEKKGECVAFGLAVRRFREKVGLSQEALAARTGIHRTYIGGIERGERNPTLLMIHRLATALRVKPAQLFEQIPSVRENR
jgi:transcriptional regulator with XRE-family HTH domain